MTDRSLQLLALDFETVDSALDFPDAFPEASFAGLLFATVWALPRSTLAWVEIAHARSSVYVAHPTSDSQFSAVLPLYSHRYIVAGSQQFEGGS
jgi:hypothetical protein